ncbi:hypothetical protein AVEN_210366-1, partial [Araneus ventricosus]
RVPPHRNIHVHQYLNDELPHLWNERVGKDELALFPWLLRSPDLAPCDFFLWGHIKYLGFVPPPPKALEEHRERIHAALITIDRMTLQNNWNEFDYRLHV